MRAYRESHPNSRGGRGISQTALLRLMGCINPYYDLIGSHVPVSKWESGDTPPTKERIETFGKALALSDEEVKGLIHLAGLNEEQPESRFLACLRCGAKTVAERVGDNQGQGGHNLNLKATTRTRKCVSCGLTGESNERWAHDPVDVEIGRMGMILDQISKANDRIRQALIEANRRPTMQPDEDDATRNQPSRQRDVANPV